jgi:hypothetical protein
MCVLCGYNVYVLLWVDICARSIGRPVLFKFIVF